jgi:hypothetical protein
MPVIPSPDASDPGPAIRRCFRSNKKILNKKRPGRAGHQMTRARSNLNSARGEVEYQTRKTCQSDANSRPRRVPRRRRARPRPTRIVNWSGPPPPPAGHDSGIAPSPAGRGLVTVQGHRPSGIRVVTRTRCTRTGYLVCTCLYSGWCIPVLTSHGMIIMYFKLS